MRTSAGLAILITLVLSLSSCSASDPGPSSDPSMTADTGTNDGSVEVESSDVSDAVSTDGLVIDRVEPPDTDEDTEALDAGESDAPADSSTPDEGDTATDSPTPDETDLLDGSDTTVEDVDQSDTTNDLVDDSGVMDSSDATDSADADGNVTDSVVDSGDAFDGADENGDDGSVLDLAEVDPDVAPDLTEDVGVEPVSVVIESVPDPGQAYLPQTVSVRVTEPVEGEPIELVLAAPTTGVLLGETSAEVHDSVAVFDHIGFSEQGTYELEAVRGTERSEAVTVTVLSHPRDLDNSGELSRVELEGGYLSCGVSSGDEGCPSPPGVSIPYRLFVPDQADLTSLPIVLYLHGAGKRGADNYRQLQQDGAVVWAEFEHQFDHPVFVVAPQCPKYRRWSDMCDPPGECFATEDVQFQPVRQEMLDALAIFDAVIAHYGVDTDRIYMTGGSMGGYGTWDALLRRPGMFAAAIPVAGGVDPDYASNLLDVGLWVSHGDADGAVLFSASGLAVEAIETLGGRPRFTRFEGRAHDIWADAWWPPLLGRGPGAGRDLIEWTYAHSRGDESPPTAPGALTAELNTDGFVELAWEAAVDSESGISQYVIMRDGVHIGTTRELAFLDDGTPTYVEHPLEAGEHEYVVHAMNGSVVVGPASELVAVEIGE